MQRNKAWRHFKTITGHKILVMKNCFRVGLFRQGLMHDLSKYSPVEFGTGVKYYQGDRSPNAAEREEKGYSEAWLHHKGRNKHHFEYWIDFSKTSQLPGYTGALPIQTGQPGNITRESSPICQGSCILRLRRSWRKF